MSSLLRLFAPAVLASVSLSQAPVFGPDLGATGDLVATEAGGEQAAPWLAPGTGAALAVWVDHRAEFNSPLTNQGSPDVFAIRVGPDGSPIDDVALRLPDAPGDALRPRAAWNGVDWLVVWENQDPNGTASSQRVILGARISGSGLVLDAEPIEIVTHGEAVGSSMGVGSDGQGWVVTFQGAPGSSTNLNGVRVLADGSVPDPQGTVLAGTSTAIFDTSLAFAGGRYLFLYSNGTVRGQFLTPTLNPIGGSFVIASGSNYHPRLATDGTNYVATWATQGSPDRVFARGIASADGSMTSSIQVSSAFDYARDPSVAWSGENWHVVYRHGLFSQEYRSVRIAPDFSLLNPGGGTLPISGLFGDSKAVVAGTGSTAVVAFEELILSELWPGEISAAALDELGGMGASHALSRSAPRQGFSRMTTAPGQFAAVFYAEDENETRIRMVRYDLAGEALDSEPVELASGPRLRNPAVAFDGTHYLVVWQNDNVAGFETDDEIYGRRVALDGALVDDAPFFVMEGRSPDVSANSGACLVVASESLGDTDFRYVFARRVVQGAPVGDSVLIGNNFARFPRVAPLGGGWIATWQRNPSHDNPNGSVRATLVNAEGQDGAELFVSSGSGISGGGYGPRVASSGSEALIVWQTFDGVVGGRLIHADGTESSGIVVASNPAVAAAPAVGFDGSEFLVAWEDYRAQFGLFDTRADVYGGRVSVQGQLLDGVGGVPIAAKVETEMQPSVAGSFGASLIAWTEFVPASPEATLRLRRLRESPWAPQGGGVGVQVEPALEVSGDLVPTEAIRLAVSSGSSSQPGLHIFGVEALSLPLAGGVLVPGFDLTLSFMTDPEGSAETEVSVPDTLPPGTPVFVQSWMLDPAALEGLIATDAWVANVP